MRVAFAGTPEFAARALEAIVAAGHEIVLVLTQPDRPAGRGMRQQQSPVKQFAAGLGSPVVQPASLRDPASWLPIIQAAPDVLVVAAYGLILPQGVLDIARLGAINIHASLLPRWRGAAPIQRAILAGDRETGITIMRMDAGLDTGPILLAQSIPIRDDDNAASLHDALAALGSRLVVEALNALDAGTAKEQPQPQQGVSYAAKLGKSEALIDWQRPASEIDRQIRAFNPVPGATTSSRGTPIKIWQAELLGHLGDDPGVLVAAGTDGVMVACGTGALRIVSLQKAGGKRLAASDFLAGFRLQAGERLGSTDD